MSAVCTTLTFWVIQLLNNTLFSLALSPSVCIDAHAHTSLHLPHISLCVSLCYDHHRDLGAVGSCSQSLLYSAFSSSSTCPSLCVSTACLNYSHQGHYWEHSRPPAPPLRCSPPDTWKPIRMRQVVCEHGGGHIFVDFHHSGVRVPDFLYSGPTCRDESLPATFLGWIIESLPDGTECTVNLCDFRLSCWSTDDQESTVLDLTVTW